MQTFGTLLRGARALLGENQEEVGRWVGLDPQEVSRWERGGYKLLSASGISLQKSFEKRGVEFLTSDDRVGSGLRWKQPGTLDPFRASQFRAARAMAGLSMRDIEAKGGVSRSFISRLESGQILALNVEMEQALSKALCDFHVALVPEGEDFGAGVRWTVPDDFVLRR